MRIKFGVGVFAILAWFLFWSFFFLALSGSVHAENHPYTATVVGVHDGDTLTVHADQQNQVRIRLAEIDAPELHQPFGMQSKQNLSRLCFGQQAIVSPVAIDRYGRTVARIKCGKFDANLAQVRAGLAWRYGQYSKDPAFGKAEKKAQSAKSGLWVDANPVPPWQFRRKPK